MIIDLIDETGELEETQFDLIEKLLQYTAENEEIDENAEMSITFVNNDEIQSINKQYRGKDQPTDVISFALEELGEDEIEVVGESLPVHLGDIIISVERAKEQASEYDHSFERELGFLAVHGFLHLLGYDHQTVEEEKEMFERQENILQEFGLKRHGKER
ncbi:rRNA maturation RNase YbeY [Bacillaceae bacterium W0354]